MIETKTINSYLSISSVIQFNNLKKKYDPIWSYFCIEYLIEDLWQRLIAIYKIC